MCKYVCMYLLGRLVIYCGALFDVKVFRVGMTWDSIKRNIDSLSSFEMNVFF